jgi:hypothetical protein
MTTAAVGAPRLSAAEVEHYRREGYLIHNRPVFSPAKFGRLQSHFEGLLGRWLSDPRMRSPEHMDVPHFMDPALFEWLLDDDVLDLVEPILGPDIALFSSHFICKPAGTGKRVPWHEDSAYWRGRMEPMEVVTVWLAVDPSTPANGCMRVIPGTHRHGYSEYEAIDKSTAVFDSEIKRTQFDQSKAVDCVLAAGECSLHDGRLIHGSAANTGAMRRCGYTMRYISTRTRVTDLGYAKGFQYYLARGRDHAGNKYADPGKINQAWIDAHKDGFPAGH